MFYRTVGVSRRVVHVRIGAKAARKSAPSRIKSLPSAVHKPPPFRSTALEERFDPSFDKWPIPSSRYSDRKTVLVVVSVIVALLVAGIYFARNSDGYGNGNVARAPNSDPSPEPHGNGLSQRLDDKSSSGGSAVPMPLNMHPMGLGSRERHSSSLGHATPNVGGGAPSFRSFSINGEPPQQSQGSSLEEINDALNAGDRKLILPSEVSGKCDIGRSGVGDLGNCLAQLGARVEDP